MTSEHSKAGYIETINGHKEGTDLDEMKSSEAFISYANFDASKRLANQIPYPDKKFFKNAYFNE